MKARIFHLFIVMVFVPFIGAIILNIILISKSINGYLASLILSQIMEIVGIPLNIVIVMQITWSFYLRVYDPDINGKIVATFICILAFIVLIDLFRLYTLILAYSIIIGIAVIYVIAFVITHKINDDIMTKYKIWCFFAVIISYIFSEIIYILPLEYPTPILDSQQSIIVAVVIIFSLICLSKISIMAMQYGNRPIDVILLASTMGFFLLLSIIFQIILYPLNNNGKITLYPIHSIPLHLFWCCWLLLEYITDNSDKHNCKNILDEQSNLVSTNNLETHPESNNIDYDGLIDNDSDDANIELAIAGNYEGMFPIVDDADL